MQGPYEKGTFSKVDTRTEWERDLLRGQRYRVVKSFRDFDGFVHPVGEKWQFLGSNFVPYDDGLSVFVADDDGAEWHMRLCWRACDQLDICENFNAYVDPINSANG